MEVKPRKSRRFSDEFKLEAIELAKKIGNSQAARDLDINESSIRDWKKKFEGPTRATVQPKTKKSYNELEKELKRLKKENGYLKEINKVLKKKHSNILSRAYGKFEVINLLRGKIPIIFMCKYFGVSSSSFYFWEKGLKVLGFKRKTKVCHEIKLIFESSKKTYGSPRVHRELKSKGISICENTVAKYMKEMNLDARFKKNFKLQTTNSDHDDPIAERLFKTEDGKLPVRVGEVLAGDITYLKYGNKHVYLAVVLDLFNREVIGWFMHDSLETILVLRALDMAMKKVGPEAEITFHSDRGSQYASEAYRKFLKAKNIRPSMSRKGNCYDNAYVESWFAS